MARVYIITEAEMQALIDSLEMRAMANANQLLGGFGTGDEKLARLTPEENNRLSGVHRAFHFICVRWAQEMGFKGAARFSQ